MAPRCEACIGDLTELAEVAVACHAAGDEVGAADAYARVDAILDAVTA